MFPILQFLAYTVLILVSLVAVVILIYIFRIEVSMVCNHNSSCYIFCYKSFILFSKNVCSESSEIVVQSQVNFNTKTWKCNCPFPYAITLNLIYENDLY